MRPPGPDRVTEDLFRERAGRAAGDEDAIHRASRVRTRGQIRRRLDDMNDQFSAIQEMSENMEHEFKNTKLVSVQS